MAKQPQRRGEPHSTIPHLYRKLGPPTTGELLYPNLRSQDPQRYRLAAPAQQPLARGLLSDAVRGATSPLGGLATPAQPSNKGRR
jgi:hypothetical protein